MPDIGTEGSEWTTEFDRHSTANIVSDSNELVFRYRLSDLKSDSPYAAAVRSLDGLESRGVNVVSLIASADRPLRVSVQLRDANGSEDVRWMASFYADGTPRSITIPFTRFKSTIPTEADTLQIEDIEAFLIVADLVNSAPGTSGELTLEGVQLERR